MQPYSERYPFKLVESRCAPVEMQVLEQGIRFIAFARAGFGTVELELVSGTGGEPVTVHFGECLDDRGRVNREPPGSIRYRKAELILRPGCHRYRVAIPPDERSTGPRAIHMPDDMGEVLPFRYVELEGYAGDLAEEHVTQVMVHVPFADNAASFFSSAPVLNAIWDLCRHTIKATSFTGYYVDGDRERIPYEGDAYINQLSHYAVDTDYTTARRTLAYLLDHPTWPTEWMLHANIMAWADYLQTGDASFLRTHYALLKNRGLGFLAREDGLISTGAGPALDAASRLLKLDDKIRDLVDWPTAGFPGGPMGENDDYDMSVSCKSVINAFFYKNLLLLGQIARVVERPEEAEAFAGNAARVYRVFNRVFFDKDAGCYRDGEGSDHHALHASLFALAFGLVPEAHLPRVVSFVKSRGMACSVYGAQYLLEGLYKAGEGQYALDLMTATHDRSWWNMIEAGSTMTLEAWDWKYKNNLDWNHAWGTAPLNIIPRYLFGMRPLEPGFAKILIAPQPGDLAQGSLVMPSPRGPVEIAFHTEVGRRHYRIVIPEGMQARVRLPESGPSGPVHEVGAGTWEW